jgi:acetyltransferase-like isoleucine patch superfamily enzyme
MPRKIPGDWHEGGIPDNSVVDEAASIETAMSFEGFRSALPVGLVVGKAAAIYTGTHLDVGPRGLVRIGDYAMLTAIQLVCDELIEIGSHCLLSWNVLIMDTYRTRMDVRSRRLALEAAAARSPRRIVGDAPASPVRIGNNVWLGFDVCVLPGVTIGDGSIIGARSVVASDIPAYVVAAGNPARPLKNLPRDGAPHVGV